MVKQEAIECISALPDTASWSDVLYSLYEVQKVETGRQEAREGKGISLTEARKMLGVL